MFYDVGVKAKTGNFGLTVCLWTAEIVRVFSSLSSIENVVAKGLLTFLGSLYKEVAKTTSGTARKKSSFEKHCVLDLECRILSQEPSYSCSLYFNFVFHGK